MNKHKFTFGNIYIAIKCYIVRLNRNVDLRENITRLEVAKLTKKRL
jgi:hypothetical protein